MKYYSHSNYLAMLFCGIIASFLSVLQLNAQCTQTQTYSPTNTQGIVRETCNSPWSYNSSTAKAGWKSLPKGICSGLNEYTYATRYKFKHSGYNNSEITQIKYNFTMSTSSGTANVMLTSVHPNNNCHGSYSWNSTSQALYNCMHTPTNSNYVVKQWSVNSTSSTKSVTLYANSGTTQLSTILDPNSDEFILIMLNDNGNKVANISSCNVEITYKVDPTADFTVNKTKVMVGNPVQFTDQSGPTLSCISSRTWNFGSGGSGNTTAQNPNATYSTSGNKTVALTVNSSNGSDTETKNSYIQVFPTLTANAGVNKSVCPGSSVSIGGSPSASGGVITSGSYTYTWSGGSGLSSYNSPNPSASPATTTTYTLTVEDENGNQATDNVTVTVHSVPTISAGLDQTICPGGTANLQASATGGSFASYSWSPSSSLSNANIVNPVASPSSTTTYTVSGTTSDGCVDQDAVVVNVNNMTFNAGSNQDVCLGNSTTIGSSSATGIGPFTYSWSPATFLTTSGSGNAWEQPNPSVTNPTSTTTYTCTITGAVGCQITESVTITVVQPPTITAGVIAASCPEVGDGEIDITLTGSYGPYTYSWTKSGTPSFSATTEDISSLYGGDYTVEITSAVGSCVYTFGPYTVNAPVLQIPTLTSAVSLCSQGNCTGTITTVVNDGVAPYTYSWSNGAATKDISNVCSGNYTLDVLDSKGCTMSNSTSVTATWDVDADLVDAVDETCFYSEDGELEVEGINGTAPYSFSWSTGETTARIEKLSAINYEVTVTDVNGCAGTDNYTLGNQDNSTWPVMSDYSGLGDMSNSITSDEDGNLYVTGYVGQVTDLLSFLIDVGIQNKGFFIAKFDHCGTLDWVTHSYAGQPTDVEGIDISYDNGKLYVVGKVGGVAGPVDFNSLSNSITHMVGASDQLMIASFDADDGNVDFVNTTYSSLTNPVGTGITNDQNGDIVICGQLGSSSDKAFVAKCAQATGSILTGWPVSSTGQTGDIANDVFVSSETGNPIYLCGSFSGTITFGSTSLSVVGGSKEAFLYKMTSAGTPVWTKQGDMPVGVGAYSEAIALDMYNNHIFVTGNFKNEIEGDIATHHVYSSIPNVFLSGFESSGTPVFTQKLDDQTGYFSASEVVDLAQDDNGGLHIHGNYVGNTVSIPGILPIHFGAAHGNTDVFVAKFELSGQGVYTNVAFSQQPAQAGGITCANRLPYVTGSFIGNLDLLPNQSLSTIATTSSLYIARNMDNPDGDFSKMRNPSLVQTAGDPAGIQYSIYPNPGNGQFTLESNASMQNARIRIYNSFGTLVKEEIVVDKTVQTKIDMDFAPGVYFLNIISDDQSSYSGTYILK